MKRHPTVPKQLSFAIYEFAQKKRVTRREKFLGEMEQVVPWGRLEALIEPKYPTGGRLGRQPIGVSRTRRMYFLQQWFGLADEALEDAVCDVAIPPPPPQVQPGHHRSDPDSAFFLATG